MKILSLNYFLGKMILVLSVVFMCITCEDENISPNQVGDVDVGVGYDVIVENETAYVANNFGIVIIDVHNPDNPREIGMIANYSSGFNVLNDTIVASGSQFTIYDVKNPSDPARICQFTGRSYISDAVRISNELGILIYSAGGIEIIDINDFAHPTSIGYLSTTWQGNELKVLQDIAYVANSRAGLEVIDISDPTHPQKIRTVSGTPGAWDIHIQGNLLFLGCHMYGIKIVDISNPRSPLVIGSYSTGGEVYGVYAWQNYLSVADLQKGVLLLDISDPSEPELLFEDKYYHPHDIYYNGSDIFLADQDKGFVILNTGTL